MAKINVPAEQYTPFSTESPGPAVQQRLNVQASPQAFGAGVGQAIEHFGDALDRVGDRLFARAMEIQNDKNEAEARDAVNGFLTDQGMKQEKFQSLLGKDPNDQLDAHIKDMNKSRDTVRAGLSNAVVQKHFDAEVAPIMRQYVVRSAGHAGAQLKDYEIGTIKAQEANDEKQIAEDPKSQEVWDRVHGNIEKNSYDLKQRSGWSEAQRIQYAQGRESALKLSQLKGLAHNDPLKGEEILDDAIKNKTIHPDDAIKARAVIDPRVAIVLGRNSSAAVNAHPEGPGNAPQWTENERNIEKNVLEPVSRVARQFNIDHGNYGIHIGAGTKESLDVVFPEGTNLEQATQEMHEVGSKIGVPVDLSVVDGKVRIEMKTGVEAKDVRAAEPESEGSRVGRATAHDRALRPNNLDIDHTTTVTTIGDFNKQQAFLRDEQRHYDSNVMQAYNGPNPDDIQSRAGNMDALLQRLKDSGQLDSWEKLSPKDQRKYVNMVNQTHAKQSDIAHKFKMRGLEQGSPEEQQEFLDHDFLNDEHLSTGDRYTFFQDQLKKQRNPNISPDVTHAMSYLHSHFPAFDDIPKDRLSTFRGFIWEQQQQYRDENKKRMPDDEIEQMGLTFLRNMPKAPFFSGLIQGLLRPFAPKEVMRELESEAKSATGRPLFEADISDIPDDQYERLVNVQRQINGGGEPTKDQLLRLYVKTLYEVMHPSKKSSE